MSTPLHAQNCFGHFLRSKYCNTIQLNPDNSNLQGNSKKVRVIGGSRVKLVRKLPGGKSKKVRVSERFELLRVRVNGIQL